MRLDRVARGDVIKASIKGRTGIWGEVTEIKGRGCLLHAALSGDRLATRQRARDRRPLA
jgi:ribosomal protein S28E/S33